MNDDNTHDSKTAACAPLAASTGYTAFVSPRSGRTIEQLIASIGRATYRCGLCCSQPVPCGPCVSATKRANGEAV